MSSPTASDSGNTERIFARGFALLGGVFWIAASFAGPFFDGGRSIVGAFGVAIYPLAFTVGVMAIGWYFERTASLVLAVAAIGSIAWGVIMGWESDVWAIMLVFFIAPTIVSALLFFLAGSRIGPQGSSSKSSPHALS